MRGKPRKFIVQYWKAGSNQTRTNKTFDINKKSIETLAPVSVNITVESAMNYKLRVTWCTVACGPWSSVASFSSYQHTQNTHFVEQGKGHLKYFLYKLQWLMGPVLIINE